MNKTLDLIRNAKDGSYARVEMPTHPKFIDRTGLHINKWTVGHYVGTDSRGHAIWECTCDCGNVQYLAGSLVGTGQQKGCRTCGYEQSRLHGIKHNKAGTKEYTAYISAKGRCNNPKISEFENYGGRGIEFRFGSFEEFYAEVGDKPTDGKYSLDRIDVNGHYEKGNVRWATSQQQVETTAEHQHDLSRYADRP